LGAEQRGREGRVDARWARLGHDASRIVGDIEVAGAVEREALGAGVAEEAVLEREGRVVPRHGEPLLAEEDVTCRIARQAERRAEPRDDAPGHAPARLDAVHRRAALVPDEDAPVGLDEEAPGGLDPGGDGLWRPWDAR